MLFLSSVTLGWLLTYKNYLGFSQAKIAPRQHFWSGMTVKYIHWSITLYVSCTINSSQIEGWSAANHCGLSHRTAGCPMGIPQQLGPASGLPLCQLPDQGASFNGKMSSVPKCWLGFVCLLDFHLFLNTWARSSFAFLSAPITGWLLLPGVNSFSALSLLLPSPVTGEAGTDLGWWQPLSASASMQNREMVLLSSHSPPPIFYHILLNCHSVLRKNRLVIFPFATSGL